LVINLLLVSSVAALVLFMPDTLPQTYVPGQGLTPLKIGLESLVIALHILTLVVLIPRTRTTGLSRQQQALVYALVLSAISEAFFMLYAQYNDLANLAGHLYKILAYVFLYQAIFLESVRGPIERLQEAQAAERSSSQRYRELIEQAPDAILVVNQHGHIEMINERLEALFGYSRDTLIGQPIEVLVPSPYRESHRQQRDAFLHAPQGQPMTNRTTVEGLHRDGRHIPLNINLSSCEVDGEPKVTAFIRDVSEWRSMENELRHMATHDALTGLPNRTLFADRLTHDLAQAQRGGYAVAVVMMDLDHFKDINDTWGHAAGDALLVEAARRLSSVLRSNDTICRIGGDEFALILPNIHVPEDVTRVADKIHEQFMQPFCLSGHDVTINATLGVSLYPEDGDNGEQLLANADVAMYAGKAQARGSLRFYTEAMNREV
ncbi:MAG: diguanylate cyclase, partial [Gammaproteobacteria bacterium]|nr:diguanylate cyclase [Gammaproteobacteria bacterium]